MCVIFVEYVLSDHLCYMQHEPTKTPCDKFIFYDFETDFSIGEHIDLLQVCLLILPRWVCFRTGFYGRESGLGTEKRAELSRRAEKRAGGKWAEERQTCFTCSAPNLPVEFSTGGVAKCFPET